MDSYNLTELKNIAKQVNVKIRAEHKENVKKTMKTRREVEKTAIKRIRDSDAVARKKLKAKFAEILKKKLIPIAKQSKTSLKAHLAKHPQKTAGLKPSKPNIDDLPLPPMPKEEKLSAAEEAEMKRVFEESKKKAPGVKKEVHTFKKGGKFFKVKAKKEKPKIPKITISEHEEKNEGGKAEAKSQLPPLKEKERKIRVAPKKNKAQEFLNELKKEKLKVRGSSSIKEVEDFVKKGNLIHFEKKQPYFETEKVYEVQYIDNSGKKRWTGITVEIDKTKGYKGPIPKITVEEVSDKTLEEKAKRAASKARTEKKLKQRDEKKKKRPKFDPAAALRKVVMRKKEFHELKKKVKVADLPKEIKESFSKLLQKNQEDELDDEHIDELKEIVSKYGKTAAPAAAKPKPKAKAKPSRFIKPFDKSPEIRKLVDKLMPEELFSKEDQKDEYESYKEKYDEIEDGKIEDPDDLDLDDDELKLFKLLFPKIKRLEGIKKEKEKISAELKKKREKDEAEEKAALRKLQKAGKAIDYKPSGSMADFAASFKKK